MTEFRPHDRVKVLDTPLNQRTTALNVGDVLIVSSVKQIGGKRILFFDGHGTSWAGERFELVEHAVNTDKNGTPLYVGDIVRRRTFGNDDAEGVVKNPQPVNGNVAFFATNRNMDLAPPRHLVELVRHHWERRVFVGIDPAASGNPFVAVGWMDEEGVVHTAMKDSPHPSADVLMEQLRAYEPMLMAARLCPPNVWGDRASNHGAGRAVDVPVQLSWDDIVIGSVVQVRVRATGEEFTAEVTESPNGTKKGQEPSPHVHGIWTGTSIVRKGWELLRNDLPVPPLPRSDGSIVAPDNDYDRSRAHRIGGRWLFAGGGETDPTRWPKGFRIIRDAEKED